MCMGQSMQFPTKFMMHRPTQKSTYIASLTEEKFSDSPAATKEEFSLSHTGLDLTIWFGHRYYKLRA